MQYLEVQPGIDRLLAGSNDCNKLWRAQLKQMGKYTPSRRCLQHTEDWTHLSPISLLLNLFVVELASSCWSLPGPRPPKSGSPWECILPRGWLLTSAERCRRVNIPAPLSSDWDNSRAAKAPCGNAPRSSLCNFT